MTYHIRIPSLNHYEVTNCLLSHSSATPIDTKGFQSLLGVVENTIADSWDLFYGLYKYNEANARDIIAAVRGSLTELAQLLEDADDAAAKHDFPTHSRDVPG